MFVFCPGMARSGSTWSFNAVRRLISRRSNSIRSHYLENQLDLIEKPADFAEHGIFKMHQMDAFGLLLIRNSLVRSVYTYREPLNAMASLMEQFHTPFEDACGLSFKSLQYLMLQKDTGTGHYIWFDDIETNQELRVFGIAKYLDMGFEWQEIAYVSSLLTKDNVKKVIKSQAKSDGGAIKMTRDRVSDTGTLFWSHHIRDYVKPIEEVFTEEQKEYIKEALPGFLDDDCRLKPDFVTMGKLPAEVVEEYEECKRRLPSEAAAKEAEQFLQVDRPVSVDLGRRLLQGNKAKVDDVLADAALVVTASLLKPKEEPWDAPPVLAKAATADLPPPQRKAERNAPPAQLPEAPKPASPPATPAPAEAANPQDSADSAQQADPRAPEASADAASADTASVDAVPAPAQTQPSPATQEIGQDATAAAQPAAKSPPAQKRARPKAAFILPSVDVLIPTDGFSYRYRSRTAWSRSFDLNDDPDIVASRRELALGLIETLKTGPRALRVKSDFLRPGDTPEAKSTRLKLALELKAVLLTTARLEATAGPSVGRGADRSAGRAPVPAPYRPKPQTLVEPDWAKPPEERLDGSGGGTVPAGPPVKAKQKGLGAIVARLRSGKQPKVEPIGPETSDDPTRT